MYNENKQRLTKVIIINLKSQHAVKAVVHIIDVALKECCNYLLLKSRKSVTCFLSILSILYGEVDCFKCLKLTTRLNCITIIKVEISHL